MSTPVLVGICGALRAGSGNRKLLHEAARIFGECDYREADLRLPLYDGDAEDATGIPAPVQALADQIAGADAIVISTPEYNKGPPGVLKNALDWVSRVEGNPWRDKPVAVMSAAAGRAGGERAQMVLRTFLIPFRARVLPGPELHLANVGAGFEDDGRLRGDLYNRTLAELMAGLRAEIGK